VHAWLQETLGETQADEVYEKFSSSIQWYRMRAKTKAGTQCMQQDDDLVKGPPLFFNA